MKATITESQAKAAIIQYLMSRDDNPLSGITPDALNVHFIKDGNSTRVDEVSVFIDFTKLAQRR